MITKIDQFLNEHISDEIPIYGLAQFKGRIFADEAYSVLNFFRSYIRQPLRWDEDKWSYLLYGGEGSERNHCAEKLKKAFDYLGLKYKEFADHNKVTFQIYANVMVEKSSE